MITVFAYIGPIGSGKSAVSRRFAATIGATWEGFGAVVRAVAAERGLGTDRRSLQELGAHLVQNEQEAFCRRVLEAGGEGALVVDGVRHIEVLERLRALVLPRTLRTIFVECSKAVRLERVRVRDGLTAAELDVLEQHSTEVETELLRLCADATVDNSRSLDECEEQLVALVQKLE